MENLRCPSERLRCVVRMPGIYLIPRGDGRVTIGATPLRAGLDAGNMLLNLRGHDLLLQTCKRPFALSYRRSCGSRRDFLSPLDHAHLVFDGATWKPHQLPA